MDSLVEAYRILNNVFRQGAYSNVEMKTLAGADKAFVTRVVYGVLEKNITLEYCIAQLADKRPKPAVALLLKIGLYLLRFMSMPEYAAIHRVVDLSKSLGKGGASGFVNAVLRNASRVQLPAGDSPAALSVRYSYPEWAVKKLIAVYGMASAKAYMAYAFTHDTHIRHNANVITQAEFARLIARLDERGEAKSTIYGYYVTHTILDVLHRDYPDAFTAQSVGSLLVCSAFSAGRDGTLLDVCAAPGGKSIYLAGHLNAQVTACDIHPHRVKLIEAYAKRMKESRVKAVVSDGSVFHPVFLDQFDAVLCDVPCSGFGVAAGKPDILLNKKEEDIAALVNLQSAILNNAARYVKPGGELVYATCTVLPEENEGVVGAFLQGNPDFRAAAIDLPVRPVRVCEKIPEAAQYLPHLDEVSGYFIAKLVKAR